MQLWIATESWSRESLELLNGYWCNGFPRTFYHDTAFINLYVRLGSFYIVVSMH